MSMLIEWVNDVVCKERDGEATLIMVAVNK